MKVVINKCHGGFSVSHKCVMYMRSISPDGERFDTLVGEEWYTDEKGEVIFRPPYLGYGYDLPGVDRNHPILVQAVETLGEEANGANARLEIVEIPDNCNFVVSEVKNSDGVEVILVRVPVYKTVQYG